MGLCVSENISTYFISHRHITTCIRGDYDTFIYSWRYLISWILCDFLNKAHLISCSQTQISILKSIKGDNVDDDGNNCLYGLYFHYVLCNICIKLLNMFTRLILTTLFYGWKNLDSTGRGIFPESHSQKREGNPHQYSCRAHSLYRGHHMVPQVTLLSWQSDLTGGLQCFKNNHECIN